LRDLAQFGCSAKLPAALAGRTERLLGSEPLVGKLALPLQDEAVGLGPRGIPWLRFHFDSR